ncbi:hypothetical protein M9458_048643, partial [Cirrhinus mrigala]
LPPLCHDPSVLQLRWAPSSLQLCLGQSSTIPYLGTPLLWLRLITLALSGSSLPPAPPWHSGSSASPWLIGSSSLPWAPLPPAPLPLPFLHRGSSLCSTVGYLNGCGLGPAWLLLLQ